MPEMSTAINKSKLCIHKMLGQHHSAVIESEMQGCSLKTGNGKIV